jgi:rhamnosyltransferase
MECNKQISIIIPTLQAERYLPELLSSLYCQTLKPVQIIIVDSSSQDGTVNIAKEFQCKVTLIPAGEFNHGGSRNLGASMAVGDVLVFLTQDAIPVGEHFLATLVSPIAAGDAVAVTARQIANPMSSPLEIFARHFNYPEISHIRSLQDLPRLGIKTYFFSNTASAIDRGIFEQLGGFSGDLIVNEDMDLCFRVIQAGYQVAYQSEAVVCHSHEYSLSQLFRRYFDIGVYFSLNPSLQQINTHHEGQRFFRMAVRFLAGKKALSFIPRLLVESSVKLLAFQIGLANRHIPVSINRTLSGQPNYWRVLP